MEGTSVADDQSTHSSSNVITYSVSFCDNLNDSDKFPLISDNINECYSKESAADNLNRRRGIDIANPKSSLDHCHCAKSFPYQKGKIPNDQSFSNSAVYGSLPEQMDNLPSNEDRGGGLNYATSKGSQRIIYCIHGKPSGSCSVQVHNKFNEAESPSQTIIDSEEHCHRTREEGVNVKARRKLLIASALCVCFMIIEIIGGFLSNSLAIATDAAHLLTDFASFMISLFAIYVAARKPTQKFLFGWHRAEVLGALVSVLTIWVVTGIIVYVGIQRIIYKDYDINVEYMLITSVFGVIVNVIMGCSLHQHGHSHSSEPQSHVESGDSRSEYAGENINVRAAYIHVIGDFIQSIGVFVAALLIYINGPSWFIVDPICTFLFSVLVMFTTFNILKDTMLVLMEGMPKGVEYGEVLDTLLSIKDVVRVHNLRIWALSLDKTALSAHIVVRPEASTDEILKIASKRIHSKYNFFEMTLQIEYFQERMEDCKQCQDPEK